MAKRLFVFILTNLAVILTISLVINLLGVQPYLTNNGINFEDLFIFCLVFGMGGAFISLMFSRKMAKIMMGVQVVPNNAPGDLGWLVATVHRLSRQAGLQTMPEVGIYESDEMNAFATGPTKNRALVAVSTGLMQNMNAQELEGVLAHEVAHIQNGDMVTMTLVQGVINAFVMFLARVISYMLSQAVDEEKRWMVTSFATIVLDILLSILGSLVVMWFSRQREFKADAGAARLAGREKMIAALEALERKFEAVDNEPALATLKIAGGRHGILALFSSHPSLEERIERLRSMVVR